MSEKKDPEKIPEENIEIMDYEKRLRELSNYRGNDEMTMDTFFNKPLTKERQEAIRALYVPVTLM